MSLKVSYIVIYLLTVNKDYRLAFVSSTLSKIQIFLT